MGVIMINANDLLTMFDERQIVEVNSDIKKNCPYCNPLSFVYVAEGFYTYDEAKSLAKEMNKIALLNCTTWRIPTAKQLCDLEYNNRKFMLGNRLKSSMNKSLCFFKGIINDGKAHNDYFVWSNTRNCDFLGIYEGEHYCIDFLWMDNGCRDASGYKNDTEKHKVFLVA